MEIEAKYHISEPEVFTRLQSLTELGAFQIVLGNTEHQHNTYYDTADGQLRAKRYGLRVRDLGDRRIATLKGESRERDGVFEREEWEVDIGTDVAPTAWPESDVRTRSLALAGGKPLLPILEMYTTRQHLYAEQNGVRIAELSLDDGLIQAGGAEERFRELEVELLPSGTRAAFDQLLQDLRRTFLLVPESRSKLQRGLALLDRQIR